MWLIYDTVNYIHGMDISHWPTMSAACAERRHRLELDDKLPVLQPSTVNTWHMVNWRHNKHFAADVRRVSIPKFIINNEFSFSFPIHFKLNG